MNTFSVSGRDDLIKCKKLVKRGGKQQHKLFSDLPACMLRFYIGGSKLSGVASCF